MSAHPCPRLFEAEAMRDGRLTGAERTSYERHVTLCLACSREVVALEAVAASLRASPPDRVVADELHVRRERTRLLAAFDRALITPGRSWTVGHRLLWPAGAIALVVALLALSRVERHAVAPVLPPNAVVHADSSAVWARRMAGDRENIVLERGALWIHVDHSIGGGRLLVLLPDGELEDTGTTFSVSVDDGRTTRVAVEEGHVVLRLHGQGAIALGPGEVWRPDPRPAASPSASVASAAAPAPQTRIDPGARSTPPPRPLAQLATPSASDPSVDFRAAMAALEVGDNAQAAAAFADFLEKHPQDRRAEDAAYLRVIALQRSGDSAGMRGAAREYLHRYPAGFRQAEVEPLSW
jgi:hypothetical protein